MREGEGGEARRGGEGEKREGEKGERGRRQDTMLLATSSLLFLPSLLALFISYSFNNREIVCMAMLSHPHVIRTHGMFMQDDIGVVQEFVHRGSLSTILADLSTELTWGILSLFFLLFVFSLSTSCFVLFCFVCFFEGD